MYALVEERREIAMRHLSQFHFVDSDEFLLLRSFMTLLCLPSSLQDLVPTKKQFTAAMKRRNHLPQFRKISAEEIHPLYWDALLKAPAVVLMTGNAIPNWAKRLSKLRPIALLTSSPGTFKRASQLPNFFAGLMKGAADIREFYRVTGE